MKSRFKTANIVALLIAATLIAIGFALNFIHQQSESAEKQAKVKKTATANIVSTSEITFARVALTQAALADPDIDKKV